MCLERSHSTRIEVRLRTIIDGMVKMMVRSPGGQDRELGTAFMSRGPELNGACLNR